MLSYTAEATDKKAGMRLDELSAFVAAAYAAGHPGDAEVNALITFRGRIKQLAAQTETRVTRG